MSSSDKAPFPAWMDVNVGGGFYEGMTVDKANVSFCVSSQEQLYAVKWWVLNEGIEKL